MFTSRSHCAGRMRVVMSSLRIGHLTVAYQFLCTSTLFKWCEQKLILKLKEISDHSS